MRAQLLVFFVLLVNAVSGGIVTTLPGYNDGNGGTTIPFSLETGYVGVENNNIQLFYYFVESQGNPSTDPILFYISGGPGCSGLWAFFFGIGPLSLDLRYDLTDTSKLPNLINNEFAWSQFMNLILIDGPAGTGFSYSKTPEGYNTSNFKFADDLNEFIHKWVDTHDRFKSNPIYISGDGYSGNPIPIALDNVLQDNKAGVKPYVNMTGYVLIGPGTVFQQDFNYRYVYANKVGFIPDSLWKVAEESCNGNYMTPENDVCELIMEEVKELVGNINMAHILDPSCNGETQGHKDLRRNPKVSFSSRKSLQEKIMSVVDADATPSPPKCRKDNQLIANAWVDHQGVKDALQVQPGTAPKAYQICDRTVDNDYYNKDDIKDLVPYHKKLSETDIRGLIISGDHDMDIPNVSLEKWIWSLELSLVEKWRPWFVANETAGYTRGFENGDFNLTYVSVKGGGHFTPQYRLEECYYMMKNWTSSLPL